MKLRRTALFLPVLISLALSLLISQPLCAQEEHEKTPFIHHFGGARQVAPKAPPSEIELLYRSLGEQHGVTIIFDDKFNFSSGGRNLNLELEDSTLEEALERLAYVANHFYKKVDESTYLIVNDTPQNRREMTDLVIRLFEIENLPVREVDKMMRSLIEARRLYTCDETNTVMMRDTADKMKIAGRLVDLLDRPQCELDVGVEILICDPEQLGQALDRLPQQPDSSPLRLTPEQLDQVRREARVVTSSITRLGVMGADHARYRTRTAGGSVEIDVRGTAHPSSNEVTLAAEVQAETPLAPDSAPDGAEGDSVAHSMVRSSFRLQTGATALITGLGVGDQEIAVALTPTVVRTARYTEADLEALRVGTESRISVDGRKGME